jgi:biotin carboxyl carrier protein
MKHRTATVAGERVDVVWTETENGVEATVHGRRYRLEMRRTVDAAYWFAWNGLSMEAVVIPQEEGYAVTVRGKRVLVEFQDSTKKTRRRGGASEGVVEVRAPMPGKIVRVLRSEGEEMVAHQGIVVMEAMKMQNEIRSPKAGKIVRIAVREGDAVKLGDLIAQVE